MIHYLVAPRGPTAGAALPTLATISRWTGWKSGQGLDSDNVSTERGLTVYGCLRSVRHTDALLPRSSRPRTQGSL